MKFLKAMLIVAVAAGALSLGACAQKKETVQPAPAPYSSSHDRRFASDRTIFNQKARSYLRPGLSFPGSCDPRRDEDWQS